MGTCCRGYSNWGCLAGALGYDLLWLAGVQGQPLPTEIEAKGPALAAVEPLDHYLGYLQYGLLPVYYWRVLTDFRRYRHYLDDNFSDSERLRFAELRQLVVVR